MREKSNFQLGGMFSCLNSIGNSSNGIDILDSSKYVDRKELIGRILEQLQDEMFVVFSAPPGSGKTSVLQLIATKYPDIPVHYVTLLTATDAFRELEDRTGINLKGSLENFSGQSMIVLLDDVQNHFHNTDFWLALIKALPVKAQFKTFKVKFVISSTYFTRIGNTNSPAELTDMKKFTHKDFKLNEDEANAIFRIRQGDSSFPKYDLFKDLLLNECSGNPGMISVALVSLTQHFRGQEKTESDVLRYYLSNSFNQALNRCFVSICRWEEKSLIFLRKLYIESELSKQVFGDDNMLSTFIKDGVLEMNENEMISFTSPMAKRFYCHQVFPYNSLENPPDIVSLVKSTIGKMSQKTLSDFSSGRKFPKEAGFQQHFLFGLCWNLKPSTVVTSELSNIFPHISQTELTESNKIEGSLDFYINSDLRWGIELLVGGDKITEHIDRFAKKGKYDRLECKDYIVIDFRSSKDGKPTNITRHEKRVSVFFKEGDYSSCICVIGVKESYESIKLEN
jgi:hypothetical protein